MNSAANWSRSSRRCRIARRHGRLGGELERCANRIARLGPINLAAVEEYQQQSERKQYLDAQNEDLESALATLESAIRKIDRETRSRFKETFDQVNSGLQELFPRVFGGGSASLEMTGDDLLDTGISILARPPGKKNSTIHLLSGGEKALTAIALVFSIFQLNPAPFCMLDEVDAPLDDANVGRYARMVKEMSEKVQFVFITHNKITMEMADHLMGVTMHEPGVSRLVSVTWRRRRSWRRAECIRSAVHGCVCGWWIPRQAPRGASTNSMTRRCCANCRTVGRAY
jgi:chromosome segregation protein